MKWFQQDTTARADRYITSDKGVITQLYEYNSILYGSLSNPAYKVMYDYGTSADYTKYYPINDNTVITTRTSNAVASPPTPSFFRIVGVTDDAIVNAVNYFTNDTYLSDEIITGKWRVHNTLIIPSFVSGWFLIPVTYTITLSDNTIITGNQIGNKKVYFGGTDTYPGTQLYFDDIIIGQNNASQSQIQDVYIDMIIDFGDTAQHVPRFLYEYITQNFDRIYPNTYTISTPDGETLASISEQPPIVKTNLIHAGDAFSLSLTMSNDTVQTFTFSYPTPPNSVLVGLGYDPNDPSVIIPVGESDTNINDSAVLYPIYAPYEAILTPFDIYLYQNTAEPNRVDKTDYLTDVLQLRGVLRDECSLIAPSIIFESSTYLQFNYVYIPVFGRYYFVLGIDSVNKNLWRMRLNCDVLMSYKEKIWTLDAVIDRQENDFNPMLNDPNVPAQTNKNIEIIEVGSIDIIGGGTFDVQDVPDITHRCDYVLLTVGEGASTQ